MPKRFSNLTKQSGNIHKISHNVLHNRFVLYFIFMVAIGNLFLFVFENDIMSIGVFFTAGLLTSFFSKNMVVIMVTAMVVANIIRFGSRNGRDGFEEKEKEKEGYEDGEEKKKEGYADSKDEGFKEEDKEGFDDEEKKKEGFFGDNDKDKEKEGFKKRKKKDSEEEEDVAD